jgi:rubrerythrin
MNQKNALDILKKAILLEKRGETFYRKVAREAENDAVKTFFEMMAGEEENHMKVLGEQFKAFKEDGTFSSEKPAYQATSGAAENIFSADIAEKIHSAGFESAAISAAIALEERAQRFYGSRAKETTDPGEKALYQWLAQWENEHLNALMKMDSMLTEQIWNDNHFWRF